MKRVDNINSVGTLPSSNTLPNIIEEQNFVPALKFPPFDMIHNIEDHSESLSLISFGCFACNKLSSYCFYRKFINICGINLSSTNIFNTNKLYYCSDCTAYIIKECELMAQSLSNFLNTSESVKEFCNVAREEIKNRNKK